ncbi:hypothetical protein J6590_030421 [Homalodisca vitripennis]|nr:hypothetical protein J6590_030421 [Homalodisca vitripennis]
MLQTRSVLLHIQLPSKAHLGAARHSGRPVNYRGVVLTTSSASPPRARSALRILRYTLHAPSSHKDTGQEPAWSLVILAVV